MSPRSPDLLYDLIAELGFEAGATVIDLGCGEGGIALELARRFAFAVHGVDPIPRHLELANQALSSADDQVRDRVRLHNGSAEGIPLDDQSVALILCREMLYHVPRLTEAFTECRRVLKLRGRVVIYQLFATDGLEPAEADWLWATSGVIPRNADRSYMEASIAAAGLSIEQQIETGSETMEWAEETRGRASQELLAAARLQRDPNRYIDQFGQAAYDIKLADSLWQIYRLIGKLSQWIYVLGRPD